MRSCLLRILLAGCTSALLLGLGEWAARRYWPAVAPIRFTQNAKMLVSQGREQSASVLVHDQELFWRLKPNVILPQDAWPLRGRISNGEGLREEGPQKQAKQTGELRLLFLGDSCTFGTGLLPQETYVERAQALLHERFPDARIECINAGVPGYTVFQGLRRLELEGFDYDPDLVLVAFGWNEISHWDEHGDLEYDMLRRARQPPALLRASRLAQLAVERLRPPPTLPPSESAPGQKGRLRLTPNEYSQMLERLGQSCSARGVELLTIVWPIPQNFVSDPAGPPHNRLAIQQATRDFGQARRLAGTEDRACLDLVPVAADLLRVQPLEAVYQDHVHGTAAANQAFAAALCEHIADWLRGRLASR